MYLGELMPLVLCNLAKQGMVFVGQDASRLAVSHAKCEVRIELWLWLIYGVQEKRDAEPF